MNREIPIVLNNQIVSKLRSGSAKAVESLVAFGLRPEWEIDEVIDGCPPHRKTAWSWSHESENPEAVHAWWTWVDRYLETQDSLPAARMLDGFFCAALENALPLGRVEVLKETWSNTLKWASRIPNWSRSVMVSRFMPLLGDAGDAAVPVLDALHSWGYLSSSDWSFSNRKTYTADPLRQAIDNAQEHLVEALFRHGVSPSLVSGESLIDLAWSRYSVISAVEESPSSRIVGHVLRQGAPWPRSREKMSSLKNEIETCLTRSLLPPYLASVVKMRQLSEAVEPTSTPIKKRARM